MTTDTDPDRADRAAREAEAPFAEADLPPDDAVMAGPHGPLIRPVTVRHVAAGLALVILVEVLGRWFAGLPRAGLVLGAAMLGSLAVKRGIATLAARTTVPLPGILWNEALRLVADLALFYVFLRLFAAILL